MAAAAIVVGVLALACGLGPTGVTGYRVSAAIGPEFNNVTLLQQALIGRHAPLGAKLDVLPNCNRRGAADVGPGDWNATSTSIFRSPNRSRFSRPRSSTT